MTRIIAIGLAVFLAACTSTATDQNGNRLPDGTTPGATAAASARSGVSHAIVSPGTVAGAMASGRTR